MTLSRRKALKLGAAALMLPAPLRAQTAGRNNVSSFSMQDWRDHFDNLGKATIVADTVSRALHFWSGDGTDYRIYPTSCRVALKCGIRKSTKSMRQFCH